MQVVKLLCRLIGLLPANALKDVSYFIAFFLLGSAAQLQVYEHLLQQLLVLSVSLEKCLQSFYIYVDEEDICFGFSCHFALDFRVVLRLAV